MDSNDAIKSLMAATLCFTLYSCGTAGTKDTSQKSLLKKDTIQGEFIGDIKLNGVVKSKDSFKNLTKYFGAPDSVKNQMAKPSYLQSQIVPSFITILKALNLLMIMELLH